MGVRFTVEVCYAMPNAATVIPVVVEPGTTVEQAIEVSGLLQRIPGLDLSRCGLGSFGRRLEPHAVVHPGDRVEVYRTLPSDPREMRRRAASRRR